MGCVPNTTQHFRNLVKEHLQKHISRACGVCLIITHHIQDFSCKDWFRVASYQSFEKDEEVLRLKRYWEKHDNCV